MIVIHAVDLTTTSKLPNAALSGVRLMPENDYKGFTMYEARIGAGQTVPLQSPEDEACVHYYYFITGTGRGQRKDGDGYDVSPDQMVALSSDVTHTLTVSSEADMRVMVCYCPDASRSYKSLDMVKSLSEITGTERDIGFGNGRSRRFIVKKDGFPLTMTNTMIFASTASRQQYRNHIEACYYISGKIIYHFQDGDGQWVREQTKIDDKNGTVFFMNLNDKHIQDTCNLEGDSAQCICFFDPPLSGEEVHHYTEDGFSSY